jgi:putative membrane protein
MPSDDPKTKIDGASSAKGAGKSGAEGSGGSGDLNVFYAAQRTMLAWVRTGIALMGFGFVVARFGLFLHELVVMRNGAADGAKEAGPSVSVWVGMGLLIAGVAVNVVAAYRYSAFSRAFQRGQILRPTNIRAELVLAGALALLGILLAAYLLRMQFPFES